MSATGRILIPLRSPAVLLLLGALSACATPPRPPAVPAGEAARDGGCALQCLRWADQCNVDPRGVQRCQHVCERFGEHCE